MERLWAGKMAQGMKVLAAKSEDKFWLQDSHGRRREQTPACCPQISPPVLWHRHEAPLQKYIKSLNFFL